MEETWRLIVTAAQRSNVQVFATTHSYDCIRGFAALVESLPELASEVSIQKIDRLLTRAVSLDAAKISIAVAQRHGTSMMATLERSLLHVEGTDDFHAICHLLIRSGIDYDRRPWPAGYPEIKEVGGKDQLLDGMETAVSLSSGRSIGFVLDARLVAVRSMGCGVIATRTLGSGDSSAITAEWIRGRSITISCSGGNVDYARTINEMALWSSFLRISFEKKTSCFFMPKRQRSVPRNWTRAFLTYRWPRRNCIPWLAWQEEPGLPYGSAIRARYFGHDSEAARSFVTWFCLLFGIDRGAAVPNSGE